jgi:hypothetical protein
VAKKPTNDRRKRVDELRRKQQRAERRGTIIAITLATLLGGGLIGGAVWATRDKRGEPIERMAKIGVTAEEAACGNVVEDDEKKAVGDHKPTGTTVTYERTPAASGPHWDPSQLVPRRERFAGRDTSFQPEQYVHNLEHGYIVVWYDADLPAEELDKLREIADISGVDKFMVAPWTRGKFDGAADLAVTGWARQRSCTKVSGAAIAEFYERFGPGGDDNVAPEPNAA